MYYIVSTINDKNFEGEKFREFFHHHLHTFMVFQLYKTATSVSTKALRSSREFSLKLSLAYLREYITDTCVHRFHAFQDDHVVTGGGELQLK